MILLFLFNGRVQVDLEVKAPASVISLNASHMQILSASLSLAGKVVQEWKEEVPQVDEKVSSFLISLFLFFSLSFDLAFPSSQNEAITFHLRSPLTPASVTPRLQVNYKGEIQNSLRGLFHFAIQRALQLTRTQRHAPLVSPALLHSFLQVFIVRRMQSMDTKNGSVSHNLNPQMLVLLSRALTSPIARSYAVHEPIQLLCCSVFLVFSLFFLLSVSYPFLTVFSYLFSTLFF